jgi:Reverse transcriptase (RNA-dependent DNA polymerase)
MTELLPYITEMCNASLQQGRLPPSQRCAIVTPRLKKSGMDEADVRSYRPISNLTFMSKIVERLVCRQLVAFFQQHSLLPAHQSAYRRQHSTETAVLKIVSDLLLACDRGQVTLLALLDLSAAFDTVDHQILLDRLQSAFGVDRTTYYTLSILNYLELLNLPLHSYLYTCIHSFGELSSEEQ